MWFLNVDSRDTPRSPPGLALCVGRAVHEADVSTASNIHEPIAPAFMPQRAPTLPEFLPEFQAVNPFRSLDGHLFNFARAAVQSFPAISTRRNSDAPEK